MKKDSGTIIYSLRRLLNYWNGSRCCGFWRWPRREAQRRYPQRSRPSEQRRPAPKSTQPSTARGRRAAGPESIRLTASLGRCSPLRGCASLAPCHPPFCLYARPTPGFQQSPNDLIRYLASPFASALDYHYEQEHESCIPSSFNASPVEDSPWRARTIRPSSFSTFVLRPVCSRLL
jgi:hypothetical protein